MLEVPWHRFIIMDCMTETKKKDQLLAILWGKRGGDALHAGARHRKNHGFP